MQYGTSLEISSDAFEGLEEQWTKEKEKKIPYLGKHEIVLMVEEIEALQHMHIRNTA